jgi:hypothetical protein
MGEGYETSEIGSTCGRGYSLPMFRRIGKALVGEPLHEPVADPAFPGLTVHTGMPYVIEGPGVGRIELREHQRVVAVGADEGVLHPPRGMGRRSADDASVRIDGHTITLHHRRLKAARILLDGTEVAVLRIEKHVRRRKPNDRTSYTVSWKQPVDPRVAGVAHLLASRCGVGAAGAGRRFLGFAADVFAVGA